MGVVAAGLCAVSCSEDFLDVSSKTESTTGNFYKTEGDAWRALVGCYDGWRQTVSCNGGVNAFYLASTIMSDECYASTGIADDYKGQTVDRFDQSQSPTTLDIFADTWKYYYAAVYRCNELLGHEETITWLEESKSKRKLYIGECRALRAICYFDMVRLWGNIPLFTAPSQENRAQADPAQVYALIVEDLKYAIENIPADANLKVETEFGRITKYAAEAILARVYLFYTGYYGKDLGYTDEAGQTTGTLTKEEALAYCEDVINSGNYELVKDFKNLWPAASLDPIPNELGWAKTSTYAGDANSEIILSMNFTPTQDYNGNNDSNRWIVMMGMRSLNFTKKGYGKGWGACCVTDHFRETFLPSNDGRSFASYIDIVGEGVTELENYETQVKDWREYTAFTVKKYCPLTFGNGLPATNPTGTMGFQECNAQPWNIVRLADVMLMAAELGSPRAANYMHDIRSRAGLSDIAVNKQNILDERARELAFEGHRYWDLLRQGVNVMADAVVASGGKVLTAGTEATVTYSRDKIIATQGLSRIPQEQMTLSNGVLKQNPGW